MSDSPWELYDRLIEGVPRGIAVTDFCLGRLWCYVEAECGMGISHVVAGGRREAFRGDPRMLDLHDLAAFSKSWCFEEATLGMAALNAWYSQPDKVRALGGMVDDGRAANAGGDPGAAMPSSANPFDLSEDEIADKRIVVVGHFPRVEALARHADLTVLERSCSSPIDTPDPACEYVVPGADLVLMTGITLTNKTAPRLLQLARDARTTITGPSALPAPCLADFAVDVIAGSVVVDPKPAKLAVRGGSKAQWRAGIKKFSLALR